MAAYRLRIGASGPPDPTPDWSIGLASDTWTAIANTSFETWADAGGITAGSYRGTDPFAAMIDAYSEMAQTADGSAAYIYGGGHGDGSCNAVVKCDFSDFGYTVVGNPTPPSVYLSSYMNVDPALALNEILYPSGEFFMNANAQVTGWFKTVAEGLNATTDAGYIAPALARVCTHMFGAAAMCGTKIVYPYLEYGEFTPSTGLWSGRGIDIGAQLNAISAQFTSVPLQQGTASVYDPTTGMMFITMVGGGFRSGIIVFDPVAQTIESVHRSGTFGNIENAVDLKMVGRDLYVIAGNDGTPRVMDWGFICDMDDLAAATGDNTMASPSTRSFTIGGDTGGSTYTSNSTQDIIPSYYDGIAIRRWNYNSTYRDKILSVSLTPASGTGTVADPYVLTQTERTISGTITGPTGQEVVYVYSRLLWVPAAGAAVVIPRASSNWYALKLS